MYVSNGILFNHESPRRGENFVTRKITRAVARIEAGIQDKLYLGNLDSVRDWGFAPEYVEAMWLSLQQERPDDYVIATGEGHTVREFVEEAFQPRRSRLAKLCSDRSRVFPPGRGRCAHRRSGKARRVFGWTPKTRFTDLVRIMVDADRRLLEDERSGRLVRVDG